VLMLAIGICFALPMEIAFEPPFGLTTAWICIEYFIEACFAIDVLVHFNTTFYDEDGNEVFSRKHIALDYFSEYHFWIDMVATIPFGSNKIAKLLPILKVIRLASISVIIKKMDVKDDVKAVSECLLLLIWFNIDY
jgi:hypothetical protein